MDSNMTKNRLVNENSVYLQFHAEDPIDWFPWCQEAFEKARRDDKPIFLSIGYSACHWCHVMQEECFRNSEVANLLNQNFISVKVDREEHPDIDDIYMHAVVKMTGSGGWPLSVFLTPDLKPFFGGTYFPLYSANSRPGFIDILKYIQKIWSENREQIEGISANLMQTLRTQLALPALRSGQYDFHQLIQRSVIVLSQNFDRDNTGWGLGPKFPPNLTLPFLLHYAGIYEDITAMEMVQKTLITMALSGLQDHVGGGFYRYCIDRVWHVPHFEKMLYDNALLANVYLETFAYTQIEFYEFVARNTLNYILRELQNPDGGFVSSQDADVEHVEGKFYVWQFNEIQQILGDRAEEFCKFFGVEPQGNWQEVSVVGKELLSGKNILDPKYAGMLYNDLSKCIQKYYELQPQLKQLFAVRESRVKPNKDNKSITSWNALAISAFVHGWAMCHNSEEYRKIANQTAEYLFDDYKHYGFLPHILHNPQIEGLLEDYTLFILSLLDLYEITLDSNWLEKAVILMERTLQDFYDSEGMGFYRVSHKNRIEYPISSKPIFDQQEPSGNASAILALAKLGHIVNSEYLDMAEHLCQGYYNWIWQMPEAFPAWLDAILFLQNEPIECTIFSKGLEFFPYPMLKQIYRSQYPYFIFKKNIDPINEPKQGLAQFCYNHVCSAHINQLDEVITVILNLRKIKK